MSLLKGNVTTTRFKILELGEPILDALKAGAFKPRELQDGDKSVGFAVCGNELSTDFTEENTRVGNIRIFSIVLEKMSVPKSEVDLRIAYRRAQSDDEVFGSKELEEWREEIVEELISPQYIKKTVTQVMIVGYDMYADTANGAMLDELNNANAMYLKMDISQDYYNIHCMREDEALMDKITDSPGLDIVATETMPELELDPADKFCCSFLTWLFYADTDGDPSLIFESPITLTGEAVGSQRVQLNKGHVSTCAEMNSALRVGKMISKATVTLAFDRVEETMWNFGLDASTCAISSCKIPKVDETEPHYRLLRRLESIEEPHQYIDTMLKKYVDLRYEPLLWELEKVNMQNWIEQL